MRHPIMPCATSPTPNVGSRFTNSIWLPVSAASWSNLTIKTTSIPGLPLETFTGAGTLSGNLLHSCPWMAAKQRNLFPTENCQYGVPTVAGFHTFSAVGGWRIGRSTWTQQSLMLTRMGKGRPHPELLCRGITRISRPPGHQTDAGLHSTHAVRRPPYPPTIVREARTTFILDLLTICERPKSV